MRYTERLEKFKKWTEENLCQREMKSPGQNMSITDIIWKKPECYLAWAPSRKNGVELIMQEYHNIAPCIIVMPDQAHAKYMEDQKFDRYSNIHRPKDLGQVFAVSMLFVVYEPGIRHPGFAESAEKAGKGIDMSLFDEGTEEGFFTLMDWMNDATEFMLRDQIIPETDLSLEETELTFGLFKDQEYVVDRRPIFYGFVNARFKCYADSGVNEEIQNILN